MPKKTKSFTGEWERTVTYSDRAIRLLDQSLLPQKKSLLVIRKADRLVEAIQSLRVRGAPAIGIAGAYGVVLAAEQFLDVKLSPVSRKRFLDQVNLIRNARPTAVNLMWAVDRMKKAAESLWNLPLQGKAELTNWLEAEATEIEEEDLRLGLELAERAQKLVKKGARLLTHCNAGGLATAGMGSALGVVWKAQSLGKSPSVWVDETRPLLQGARLTAFELARWGVRHTLICDNMAAMVMKQGLVDAVFVGADRIASNGDAANKIGTYGLAVAARYHKVPFYVCAPYSTFDFSMRSGAEIPIEERNPDEVRGFRGTPVAQNSTPVYNPAFDVVPASLVTALVTERGVISSPNPAKIRKAFQLK